MPKLMSFALGILMGTIMATAWANYAPSSSNDVPSAAAAAMNPLNMMINSTNLPAQGHLDAH